jgi:predicted tellurium resistance membrane protein TerC
VLTVEWISDPTAWLGLLTLVVLEIVLGIDNLIFIAVLANTSATLRAK